MRSPASGAALELRLEGRIAPRIGYDVTLSWGLTDWSPRELNTSVDGGTALIGALTASVVR